MNRTTASLDLSIWRNDDVYEFPLRVIGPNLTGVNMRAQIRQERDASGLPYAALEAVTNGNAQGIRLVSATFVDGRWVNDVRIRINKSTRQAMPYSGNLGDPKVMRWAFAIGGRTRIDGRVFVLAHAMDSDNAPLDRPMNYGALDGFQADEAMPSSGATLTIAADSVAELVIDGADLVERTAATSQDAAARSEVSAAQAGLYAMTALGAIGGMMYPTLAAGAAANGDGKPFSVIGDGTNTYAILYTVKSTVYDFRNGAMPAGTAIRRAVGPWSRTKADKLIETGTAANVPRFDYSGTTPALLVEPERTNVLPSSLGIDLPPWIKINPVTIVGGQSDPLGGMAASLVTHPAGSLNGIYYSLNGGMVANALYGQSVYTKRPAGSTATAHQLITNASGVGGTGTNTASALSTAWARQTAVRAGRAAARAFDGDVRVTSLASPPPWWAPFVPVVSLLMLIAGVVLTSGGYITTLKENTRRIDQLEAEARTDAKTRTEMLQQLDLRLARIEVKLEMMAPPKDKAP
jgi:hypothetical protein